MGYFCHVKWNSLLADLSLHPLNEHEKAMALRLVDGGWCSNYLETNAELAAIDRLDELGLVYRDDEYWATQAVFEDELTEVEITARAQYPGLGPDEVPVVATSFLDEIKARGLLPQIGIDA